LDISDHHADFHEGNGIVGAWQGCGMAFELQQHGMVRHGMCELAFSHFSKGAEN
jgi:hypothetical protein